MALDKSKVVFAISDACRNRKVTHLLLSRDAYKVYSAHISRDSRKRGIRHATCHGVSLLPVSWLPVDVMIGFTGTDRSGQLILSGVRVEDRKFTEDLLVSLINGETPNVYVTRCPEKS